MSEHWIQTMKGTRFDLLEPDPAMLDIEEIAHALSLLCRFTGHVRQFMSVAQHSVMVARIIERLDDGVHLNSQLAYDGLMHDATEAYVGDVARPLKRLLPDYKRIEDGIAGAIAQRFSVTNPLPELVKVADNVSLLWERRDLMALPPESWSEESVIALVPDEILVPWEPKTAEHMFLGTFERLSPRNSIQEGTTSHG